MQTFIDQFYVNEKKRVLRSQAFKCPPPPKSIFKKAPRVDKQGNIVF